jgi:hypothetical protein
MKEFAIDAQWREGSSRAPRRTRQRQTGDRVTIRMTLHERRPRQLGDPARSTSTPHSYCASPDNPENPRDRRNRNIPPARPDDRVSKPVWTLGSHFTVHGPRFRDFHNFTRRGWP